MESPRKIRAEKTRYSRELDEFVAHLAEGRELSRQVPDWL
jgi:hypothetical protein